MRVLLESQPTSHSPESLLALLPDDSSRIVLRTSQFDVPNARFSIVTHRPFLTFECHGAECLWRAGNHRWVEYGNPWDILGAGFGRFELPHERDVPFPLGGVFGYWGYELNRFVEPRLPRPVNTPHPWPECRVGFHSSLVVFDHLLNQTTIVATGFRPDGTQCRTRAANEIKDWSRRLQQPIPLPSSLAPAPLNLTHPIHSSMSRAQFINAVQRAQAWIHSGDIYQVNLSHRLSTPTLVSPTTLYARLQAVSPAPFNALFESPSHSLIAASPELFLRMSGSQVVTRPIKGTRPRSNDPARDARWMYELQTSAKETAELVMITDLLRNDLGRICEFGSVIVPDLLRLERFTHVQHLVSTIEGQLRPDVDHVKALAACFPGGSITGAPKLRAMEVIHHLENVPRGPYCGCMGYLGFNRESQLSITIRSATLDATGIGHHVGAGIVADSDPEAEYEETLAKARGFLNLWDPATLPEYSNTIPPTLHP